MTKVGHKRLPIRWGRIVLVAAAFGLSAIAWLVRSPLNEVEGWAADRMQEALGGNQVPDDLVLLVYDDSTQNQAAAADLLDQSELKALSSWPVPRYMWSELLHRLQKADVAAVAFDVVFDQSKPGDEVFAEALRMFKAPVVLATAVDDPDQSQFGLLAGLIRPHEDLLKGMPNVQEGHIAVLGDFGGVVRRSPRSYAKVKTFLSDLDPPASLSEVLHRSSSEISTVPVPDLEVWTESLSFYGPPGKFRTMSLWNVFEDGAFRRLLQRGSLRNSTVLIANTTLESQDFHPTPFAVHGGMPGIEIHATALANLRQDNHLLLLRAGFPWLAGLAVWGVLLVLVLDRVDRPPARLLWSLITAACLVVCSVSIAITTQRFVPMASWMGATLMLGLLSSGEASFRLQRTRKRLQSTLSKYLSPAVTKEVIGDLDKWDLDLGGKAHEVIVLMTDIRGFTAKTTKSTEEGTVAELVDRLNTYFTAIVEELMALDATVDKYVGDSVLAYFGAPISRGLDQDACAAVEAARRICRRLRELNQQWESQDLEPWEQIIVLSAGSVICGNIGSPKRLDYTIIGDAVNRVSRLEALAKQHSCSIVASSEVIELTGLTDESKKLGEFMLRGQSVQSVFSVTEY
ncbi:MAG: CHASE2 domain-containing protein [Prochlorococcus sp.]